MKTREEIRKYQVGSFILEEHQDHPGVMTLIYQNDDCFASIKQVVGEDKFYILMYYDAIKEPNKPSTLSYWVNNYGQILRTDSGWSTKTQAWLEWVIIPNGELRKAYEAVQPD